VIKYVSSLIKEFSKYDLAITGGGITAYEANASGLPSLIIANEKFEISSGKYLDSLGSSIFLGFYDNINERVFQNLFSLKIMKMSLLGLNHFNLNAIENIYKEIISL